MKIEEIFIEIRKFSPVERLNKLNLILEQKPPKDIREKVLEEIKRTELEIQQLKLWKAIGEIPQQNIVQEETPEEPRPIRREENLEEIAITQQKKEEAEDNNIENMYSSSPGESAYMPESNKGEENLYASESYKPEKFEESSEREESKLTNQYTPKSKEKKREEDLNNNKKSILEKMKEYRR